VAVFLRVEVFVVVGRLCPIGPNATKGDLFLWGLAQLIQNSYFDMSAPRADISKWVF
jgi:hypothetical protein